MSTHVAFLRAINVPGHAILRMDDLKQAFVAAGCVDARTYVQSGNVLFRLRGDARAVERRIRGAVASLVGAEPTIVFRRIADLDSLVAARPFGKRDADPTLKLYVVFLATAPTGAASFPIRLRKERLEAIGKRGLDVLVVSRRKPSGMYGFPNDFVERALGVAATSRNWNTVRRIAALAADGQPPAR